METTFSKAHIYGGVPPTMNYTHGMTASPRGYSCCSRATAATIGQVASFAALHATTSLILLLLRPARATVSRQAEPNEPRRIEPITNELLHELEDVGVRWLHGLPRHGACQCYPGGQGTGCRKCRSAQVSPAHAQTNTQIVRPGGQW